MKRLVILLCLVVMLPIGIRAQEDHDIAASLNLNEVVVLADGMTFEEYLVKQVLENAKPLKKRLQTLRYSVTCKLDKDLDLTQIPHRRTVTFAAKLAGYGQIVKALMEHKVFGITMAEDVLFNKGNARFYVDRKKWPNGYISMQMTYTYHKLKA